MINIIYKIKTEGVKVSKYLIEFIRSYSGKAKSNKAEQPVLGALKCLERLKALWKRGFEYSESKITNIRGIIKDIEIYKLAYGKLSKSKGSLTPGPNNETIDGITIAKLESIMKEVLSGKYQWEGVKRIEIPKNKNKIRKLGIPSFKDRIVQEVLRIILEPIFEPIFKHTSHGFRPGRSCHTALKMLKKDFKASRWYIEGDISKYFDTIDHKILMKLIEKKVEDKLILNLISTGLKSKIITFTGINLLKEEHSTIGTPQGGILSPLLANIYLHELDLWIEERKSIFNKGEKGRYNPSYDKLTKKIRSGRGNKEELLKERSKVTRTDFFDPNFRKLSYIRYADDFLIGIRGTRKDAEKCKEELKIFLKDKLKLELNEDKTKITSISKGITFLGHRIWFRFTDITQKYGKNYRRIRKHFIALDGEEKRIMDRLKELGFYEIKMRDGKLKIMPTPCYQYLHLPQSETNLKINSLIKGICEWFKLAGNRKRIICKIAYILLYSTAKLYAAKFKISSISKVFKKAGKDLSKSLKGNKRVIGISDDRIEDWENSVMRKKGKTTKRKIPGILYTKYKSIPGPESSIMAAKWEAEPIKNLKKALLGSSSNSDLIISDFILNNKKIDQINPLTIHIKNIRRSILNLNASCINCGNTDNVEMHHIKKVADIKPEDKFNKYMIAIKSKQIPLCKNCHLLAHKGNWKNKPIKPLPNQSKGK